MKYQLVFLISLHSMLLATPDVISDKPEQTPEEEFFYLLDKLRKQQLQDEQEASQGNYDESLKSSQEGLSPDSSYINPGINPGFPYAMPSVYEPSNYYKKKAKLLDDELVEKVLEQCPAEIEEAIDIINDNSHETSLRIILSGSPGVGKTTVAKAIAQRTGHTYILLRGTALSNQYQFSGEQNLAQSIAPLLDNNESCIVIIDEIDALKQYHGNKENQDSSPAGTLCSLLDDCEDNQRLIFIGTTNKIKQVPEDLKSRFSLVEIKLPNKEQREQILWYYLLKGHSFNLDDSCSDLYVASLAKKTNGFAARELKVIITQARSVARKRKLSPVTINKEDLDHGFKIIKPHIASAKDRLPAKVREFVKQHWVALLTITGTAIGLYLAYKSYRAQLQAHKEQMEAADLERTRIEQHYQEDKVKNESNQKIQGELSEGSIGLGMVGAGAALCGIPIIGPYVGIPSIVGGVMTGLHAFGRAMDRKYEISSKPWQLYDKALQSCNKLIQGVERETTQIHEKIVTLPLKVLISL